MAERATTMHKPSRATEVADAQYVGLDTWPNQSILNALHLGQAIAVASVAKAIPSISAAADLAVGKLSAGGRLIYLASGSPALIALGDSLEIPQTYGIAADRVICILAGGLDIVHNFSGVQEDDLNQAQIDVDKHDVGVADCVVAISASGSTPFTTAGLEAARSRGASTVAITSNGDAPMLDHADVGIVLHSGPEVIAGSTRMGAGSAQKVTLNMLSTLIAVRLGHVYDGLMVNLRADNAKLIDRAIRIVAAVAKVDVLNAGTALEKADGELKPAVLIAGGIANRDAADELLRRHGGNLRAAMSGIVASGV